MNKINSLLNYPHRHQPSEQDSDSQPRSSRLSLARSTSKKREASQSKEAITSLMNSIAASLDDKTCDNVILSSDLY